MDYIALFRIAHLVGTPIGAFEIPAKAEAWMESIMLAEIDLTEISCMCRKNFWRWAVVGLIVMISMMGLGWESGVFLLSPDGRAVLVKCRGAYTARAVTWLDEMQIAVRYLSHRILCYG